MNNVSLFPYISIILKMECYQKKYCIQNQIQKEINSFFRELLVDLNHNYQLDKHMIRILSLANKIHVYIVVDLMIKSISWLVKKTTTISVTTHTCNASAKHTLYASDVTSSSCSSEWYKPIDTYSCSKNILALSMSPRFRHTSIAWWNNCQFESASILFKGAECFLILSSG